MLRAWALSRQGQAEGAIAAIEQAIADWRATGAEAALTLFALALADAYAQAGQVKESLAAIDKALELVDEHQERAFEAELHRMKGVLLLSGSPGATAAAEACFRQALAVARHQAARTLELRAVLSFADLCRKTARHSLACSLLSEVCNELTDAPHTPELREAHSLLRELEIEHS